MFKLFFNLLIIKYINSLRVAVVNRHAELPPSADTMSKHRTATLRQAQGDTSTPCLTAGRSPG